MRKALLFVSLALSLVACDVLSAPTAAPKSTAIPSPSRTAKRTRSPAPRPSATPDPLETASAAAPTTASELVPSLTPSRLIPSPAPAPTIPSELDCELIWQSPSNRAIFRAGEKFSVGWDIKNIGTATWDAQSVEFIYLGGAKLHNDELSHLDTSVAPGDEIILSVPMKAPKNSTKYTTYWGLRQGDTFFCRLMLSIYVTR